MKRSQLPAVTFAKQPAPRRGVCLIVENGVACDRDAANRGLCLRHTHALRRLGRVEELALPARVGSRLHTLDVRPHLDAALGACRVLEGGVPCDRRGRRVTGVCLRHQAVIRQRTDLRLEDFAPPRPAETYTRKDPVNDRVCAVRVQLAGESAPRDCARPAHTRGLCRTHYRMFVRDPVELARLADPLVAAESPAYGVKHQPRAGICVVVEDGVSCSRPVEPRAPRPVCAEHLAQLARAGVLHRLTQRCATETAVLERRAPSAVDPRECALQFDGVACRNRPHRRGICVRCVSRLAAHGLTLDVVANPPGIRRSDFELSRKPHPVRGVCVAVDDGVPCSRPSHGGAWGLCSAHYKRAMLRGRLHEVGVSPHVLDELPAVQHFYLDKNVVMRHAMRDVFGVTQDPHAIDLVTGVLVGRLCGTVSLDCIRAVHAHLVSRMVLPVSEGGLGTSATTADTRAREYAARVFYAPLATWTFATPSSSAFRDCATLAAHTALSLEDALEVEAFRSATSSLGCTHFVTADRAVLADQPDALSPEAALARIRAGDRPA